MDLNLTLLGEMLTFIVFIWVTMKYIWPPIVQAMEERRKKIADGIAAGEHGRKTLELAKEDALNIITDAKKESSHLVEQANLKSAHMIEEAKAESRHQSQRITDAAQADIQQQMLQAKSDLQKDTVDIALLAAEKILQKKIDRQSHDKMIHELIENISSKK